MPEPDGDAPAGVVVPHDSLSEQALLGVVENFVLREGTEYGAVDVSLEEKVAAVVRQLRRDEARIVYDARSDSVDIVPADRMPLVLDGSEGDSG